MTDVDPGADRGDPEPEGGGIEIELKYVVLDRAALEPLLRGELVPGLRAGPERTVEMVDGYLDTADRAVERAGYAARLRHAPAGASLELKSLARGTASSAALHRRTELVGPAVEGLDPRDWPSSPARAALLERTGDAPIEERFSIRQVRRRWDLQGDAGRVEMSLDEVEVVRHDEVVGRRTVLEAELLGGPETLLGELGAALEATGLVRPDERSKFEIAIAMLEGVTAGTGGRDGEETVAAAPPSPPKPPAPDPRAALVAELRGETGRSPGVLGSDTLAEAGRKVLRFHLARMLAQERAARTGEAAEPVHDMRVATRRMRAAWRVFGEAFRPRLTRRYVAELRNLAAALGRVRDLDVLLDALETYGAALPEAERDALGPLREAWREEQARARRELQALLDSGAYARFVDDYVAFVRGERGGETPTSATEPHRVRDTAGSRIWRAYEQVRVYDAVLPWADLATLHQLRIAGKRLRYSIEFFREPLGPDAALLITRVVALQDHLGALHDGDVAASLARAFLVERATRLSPESIAAVGRYLASREREVARLRRSLGPVWRRIVAVDYRRALGRATGRL